MKRFATAWVKREREDRNQRSTNIFNMVLDNDLPSHQAIIQQNENVAAMEVNRTLEDLDDKLPEEI